ncbi:MAG: cysteine--tRNA ligase [Planctomycetota bacterium]
MIQPQFYNTLTNRVEPLVPIEPGRVTMYNCGPTVYDFAHIGNFKTFLFADVLRRTLELLGFDVHQVMNITDVGHMTEDQLADGGGEDKMAVAAERLKAAKKSGEAHATAVADADDPYQVAEFYTQAFIEDARALRIRVAEGYPENMPHATQHIGGMLNMIGRLIDKGHAYVAADGAVYFHVESFPEYGQLSGNRIEDLKGGAGGRVVAENQAGKRHPADFLLWKQDAAHLMKWDPRDFGLDLGEGYPGWHIECSAMARAMLGREEIDIHTGGEDNIFPHHECEIAQSRCAHGTDRFAQFWMHSRHLMIEGKKMSKSAGNFFTARQVFGGDFTGRPVDPAVLRFELIKASYRSQIDVSRKGLADSASAVRKLRDCAAGLGEAWEASADAEPIGLDHPVVNRFASALADDLNTAGALAVVFEFVGQPVTDQAEAAAVLRRFDSVLAVVEAGGEPSASEAFDAQGVCEALDAARAAKDYAAADKLRAQLIEAGYEVKTTAEGTVAAKLLA